MQSDRPPSADRRDGRLVEDVVHAPHRALRDGQVREIALEKLDARHVIEVAPMPRYQVVGSVRHGRVRKLSSLRCEPMKPAPR